MCIYIYISENLHVAIIYWRIQFRDLFEIHALHDNILVQCSDRVFVTKNFLLFIWVRQCNQNPKSDSYIRIFGTINSHDRMALWLYVAVVELKEIIFLNRNSNESQSLTHGKQKRGELKYRQKSKNT